MLSIIRNYGFASMEVILVSLCEPLMSYGLPCLPMKALRLSLCKTRPQYYINCIEGRILESRIQIVQTFEDAQDAFSRIKLEKTHEN